jgi:exosortase D (VPLPA-CTERM-specific)
MMNGMTGFLAWVRSPIGMIWSGFFVGMAWLMTQTGLLAVWLESEEYGHGLMVLGVLVYLVYRRWDYYRPDRAGSLALSLPVAAVGVALSVLGVASGISLLGYYGIWLFGVAGVLAAGGWLFFRKLLLLLLVVLLLFPLPNPLGPMLTSELQLVSSKLGVWFIRVLGGSVYLEGNVLDMGGSRLLVAEACAGLRYLFPLLSLGAILGLVLNAPLWIRWVVFVLTIPITIFMNSFRIAVTGILVESGGTAHTEGFLHFFEGWVVFVVATILLLVLAWLLMKVTPGAGSLVDALNLDLGPGAAGGSEQPGQVVVSSAGKRAVLMAAALVLLAAVAVTFLSVRVEVVPERKPLEAFPHLLDGWQSKTDRLPSIVEAVAGATEYFYGDFNSPDGDGVNVYISYYETQRHGQIPHSPKVCIPGGGWRIDSLVAVALRDQAGRAFEVNRLVTSFGDRRVITYFWLKQGGRVYRNETLARLDLIRRSLAENRTDGALIRLVTELSPNESLTAGDARLQRFATPFIAVLPDYVPD